MAIYINGKKVAGRGVSGKSPYQVARDEGYTGTEAEFNAQLAAIGQAVAGFDELSSQVENAKANIEVAVQAAQNTVTQALQDIEEAKRDLDNKVSSATTTIENKVNEAISTIDEKVEDALAQIPDSENLATKVYVAENYPTKTDVSNAIQEATASIVTDIFAYGSTAPENTKLLWIDSNANTGGLKYYNTTSNSWVHVPVAWA